MKRLLSSEPALTLGLLQSAIALAVAFGLDLEPGQVGAITAFAAALLALVLRQVVVAPDTLVDIAGRAATQTAEALSGPTVGVVGTVTDKGATVVLDTVDLVLNEVGGLVPRLTARNGGE